MSESTPAFRPSRADEGEVVTDTKLADGVRDSAAAGTYKRSGTTRPPDLDLKAIRARCGKGHVSLRNLAQRAAYCIDPMSDGGVAAAQSLADIPSLIDEVERLRRVERHASEVMDYLEKYGPSIVPHLLDDDDNSGEFLRRALNGEAPDA